MTLIWTREANFFLDGVLFTAKAAKEIILSAGAVGTPSILLHSGIGDRTTLTSLGIKSLIHLPSVGRNASDQPTFNAAQWLVNSTQTLDSIYQNTTLFNEAYGEWNRTHTGLFATQGGPTHLAWLRLDPESFAANNFTDPSAGPNSPHFQVIFIVSHFQG
jgi:choline dehydrogenase-like flavoprotein